MGKSSLYDKLCAEVEDGVICVHSNVCTFFFQTVQCHPVMSRVAVSLKKKKCIYLNASRKAKRLLMENSSCRKEICSWLRSCFSWWASRAKCDSETTHKNWLWFMKNAHSERIRKLRWYIFSMRRSLWPLTSVVVQLMWF